MRLLAAASLAVAAALFAAPPASADAFTDCFTALSVEVDERIDALPEVPGTKAEKAELKALLKVRKILDREYRVLNLAVDARNASKIVKTLLKVYPSDGEIAGILDAMVDCLEQHCGEDYDHLQELIMALPEGKKQDGLIAGHVALQTRLARLAGAATTTDRSRFAVPAASGLVSLRRRYGGVVAGVSGKGGVTAVIDRTKVVGAEIEGSLNLDGEGVVISAGFTSVAVVAATGEQRTVTAAFQGLVGPAVQPGVFEVGALPIQFTFSTLGGPNPPVFLNATAGTLVLMTVDPESGSLAGALDCTAVGPGEEVVTMKAKFNLSGLAVNSPE